MAAAIHDGPPHKPQATTPVGYPVASKTLTMPCLQSRLRQSLTGDMVLFLSFSCRSHSLTIAALIGHLPSNGLGSSLPIAFSAASTSSVLKRAKSSM